MSTRTRRITRRGVLRGTAATLVVLAGGGVYRAMDQGIFSQGEGPAYEPWTNWRTDPAEGPLGLVRAAILAANPHNIQPWRFRVTDREIAVSLDERHLLGAVDPLLREVQLGIGCAIENLVLAAGATGYQSQVAYSGDRPLAVVTLSAGTAVPSPLYAAIPHRHTNRGAYDSARPLDAATRTAMDQLGDAADVRLFWFVAPADRAHFGAETIAATEAFIADGEQSADSHRFFRYDWSDIQLHRDGPTIDAQLLPPLLALSAKMLPAPAVDTANGYWLENTRTIHIPTAAAFGVIAVRDHRDPRQRVRAGRLWQRLHLWATTQQIAMHPLNQLTERRDREEQLGLAPRFGSVLEALLAAPGWQAVFPFRAGYPTVEGKPSPRRAITDVIDTA